MRANDQSNPIVFVPTVTGDNWQPSVGEFTSKYLDEIQMDQGSKDRIVSESAGILGSCTDPTAVQAYGEAGLVVGLVQSGKTMSFTTIFALARDNGYAGVILLAGITNLLKDQSLDRLVKDLGLSEYQRDWRIYKNPSAKPDVVTDITEKIDNWKKWRSNPSALAKPSLLIAVLKSPLRINNLAQIFNLIETSDAPFLIVDDESDQASPNTKSSSNLRSGNDDASKTFEAIGKLRIALKKHSYLQYTATPQANLLAAKTDQLSPKFGRVISPGDAYTGGEFFFGPESGFKNIVELDPTDTIDPKNLPKDPPESLVAALRSFWLGAAVRLCQENMTREPMATRSMMIQVSQRTAPQGLFKDWAQSHKTFWKMTLQNSDSESFEELKEDFLRTYADLMGTFIDIPSFDECFAMLDEAISGTEIVEVNSTADAVEEVNWANSQFWILVGGMKLDRGFTVKGITTTYMPRDSAENADTLQQRARFFGYHREYAGLCRIYLAPNAKAAFVKYVDHELALRESLVKNHGKPLSSWKREFILSRVLRRATRANVVGLPTKRSTINEGWLQPKFMHESDESIAANDKLFRHFASEVLPTLGTKVEVLPNEWKDLRRNSEKHVLFEGVPTLAVVDLLSSIKFTNPDDALRMQALAIVASLHATHQPVFDVVIMNNYSTSGQEGRNPDSKKGIDNVFIGRNPSSAGQDLNKLTYVGDRSIHRKVPTLHIRNILINSETSDAKYECGWIAARVTEEFEEDILSEMDGE